MNSKSMQNLGKHIDRQTELSNCTFVKTILMLLVVFYHSILFWGGDWFTKNPTQTSGMLKSLAAWLNTFHIYGFALVSGYLFYYIRYERGGYKQFFPFVVSKAKRLLVPYIFSAVIWVIPIGAYFFQYDVTTVIKSYILAISPGQLWFLVMLFDVFVIFWLLADFVKKHNLLGALAVLLMYGCGYIGLSVLPNVFMVWQALFYMPLFWIGFKLRQYGTALVRKIPALVWVMTDVLLFFLVRYLGGFDSLIFKLLRSGFNFVLNVVGALMAFVVLQKIADKVDWNNRHFAFLSKRSMTVYLFHQQIIYFSIYFLNGVIDPYLNAAVNFVVSLAISLLMATVLMKFKVTRFLIGEK